MVKTLPRSSPRSTPPIPPSLSARVRVLNDAFDAGAASDRAINIGHTDANSGARLVGRIVGSRSSLYESAHRQRFLLVFGFHVLRHHAAVHAIEPYSAFAGSFLGWGYRFTNGRIDNVIEFSLAPCILAIKARV